MGDLSLVFPGARVVRAGSIEWAVLPLTLRDLAALEAQQAGPDPLDGRRTELALLGAACGGDALADTDEGRAYAALLRDLHPACAGWGAEERRRAEADMAGWLVVTLSRTHPGFGAAEALELLGRLTIEEWTALQSAAFGVQPIQEWAEMAAPAAPGPPGQTWAEAICRMADGDPLRLEAAGRLTINQFKLLRSDGAWRPGEPRGDRAEVRRVNSRKRAVLKPPG
jgi:hypothetical protein